MKIDKQIPPPGPERDRELLKYLPGWVLAGLQDELIKDFPDEEPPFVEAPDGMVFSMSKLPNWSQTDHNAFFSYVVPALQKKGIHFSIHCLDYQKHGRNGFIVTATKGEMDIRTDNEKLLPAASEAAIRAFQQEVEG